MSNLSAISAPLARGSKDSESDQVEPPALTNENEGEEEVSSEHLSDKDMCNEQLDPAIFDEADNILVHVNINEDDFPSEDEFEVEDETDRQREVVDSSQEDRQETVTTPTPPMNDQIGINNSEDFLDVNNLGNVGKGNLVRCDSEVVLHLPNNETNNLLSDWAAKEMLERMEKDNPGFVLLMDHLVDKKLKNKEKDAVRVARKENSKGNGGNKVQGENEIPMIVNPIKATPVKNTVNTRVTKSPSDTTIYAPGLQMRQSKAIAQNDSPINVIDQISNFVERVRLETAAESPVRIPQKVRRQDREGSHGQEREPQPSTSGTPHRSGAAAAQSSLADTHAADMLVQADQYKPIVQKPKGMLNNPVQEVSIVNVNDVVNTVSNTMNEDDEFFHLMCHVDKSLRTKIQNGEYVELEKLLPRGRAFSQCFADENRMQLVNRKGGSYWVPAEKEKVNTLKKWDQAFRVYASIYSRANPHRSHEIWQYVHVIMTAASHYIWENVAEYDVTFCQLMAAYPHRNWGKIYNQMWNLAMKEPVQRTSNYRLGR